MRSILFLSRVTLALAVLASSQTSAYASGDLNPVPEPTDRPAVEVRLPLKNVLLDVTYAGDRLVAVGERGVVLLSDDNGSTWRQAKMPESVTLTRVRFVTPKSGWAVGHYGTVLHTEDGGESWTRQLDGVEAARLALASAEEALKSAPDDRHAKRSLMQAQRLVSDGADKPFLDLHFFDEQHGIVVGAYNLILGTSDGGKSWRSLRDHLDNPREMHLYAAAGIGDTVYVAGEQGLVFRSDDRGETFSTLETPYSGTYFFALVTKPNEVLLTGLRGHAFSSFDRGETWQELKGAPAVSFFAATPLADDKGILLANNIGQAFTYQGGELRRLDMPNLQPVSSLLQLNDGSLISVGMRGLKQVILSEQGGN